MRKSSKLRSTGETPRPAGAPSSAHRRCHPVDAAQAPRWWEHGVAGWPYVIMITNCLTGESVTIPLRAWEEIT